MVRFYWPCQDGNAAHAAAGGLHCDEHLDVVHAVCSIDIPGQGAGVEGCFTFPRNYMRAIGQLLPATQQPQDVKHESHTPMDVDTSAAKHEDQGAAAHANGVDTPQAVAGTPQPTCDVKMRRMGVLLAHGDADANDWRAPLMSRLATTLASHGFVVMRYNCKQKEQRRQRIFERTLDAAAMSPYTASLCSGGWILIGTGAGARVAAAVGTRHTTHVAGFVLMCYPLNEPMPANKGGPVPTSEGPLLRIRCPTLLVQPQHSAYCSLRDVHDVCGRMHSMGRDSGIDLDLRLLHVADSAGDAFIPTNSEQLAGNKGEAPDQLFEAIVQYCISTCEGQPESSLQIAPRFDSPEVLAQLPEAPQDAMQTATVDEVQAEEAPEALVVDELLTLAANEPPQRASDAADVQWQPTPLAMPPSMMQPAAAAAALPPQIPVVAPAPPPAEHVLQRRASATLSAMDDSHDSDHYAPQPPRMHARMPAAVPAMAEHATAQRMPSAPSARREAPPFNLAAILQQNPTLLTQAASLLNNPHLASQLPALLGGNSGLARQLLQSTQGNSGLLNSAPPHGGQLMQQQPPHPQQHQQPPYMDTSSAMRAMPAAPSQQQPQLPPAGAQASLPLNPLQQLGGLSGLLSSQNIPLNAQLLLRLQQQQQQQQMMAQQQQQQQDPRAHLSVNYPQ